MSHFLRARPEKLMLLSVGQLKIFLMEIDKNTLFTCRYKFLQLKEYNVFKYRSNNCMYSDSVVTLADIDHHTYHPNMC